MNENTLPKLMEFSESGTQSEIYSCKSLHFKKSLPQINNFTF